MCGFRVSGTDRTSRPPSSSQKSSSPSSRTLYHLVVVVVVVAVVVVVVVLLLLVLVLVVVVVVVAAGVVVVVVCPLHSGASAPHASHLSSKYPTPFKTLRLLRVVAGCCHQDLAKTELLGASSLFLLILLVLKLNYELKIIIMISSWGA